MLCVCGSSTTVSGYAIPSTHLEHDFREVEAQDEAVHNLHVAGDLVAVGHVLGGGLHQQGRLAFGA